MDEMNYNQNNQVPGKGAAIGGLVCGIIALVIAFTSVLMVTPIIGLIVAIVGMILASNAKKQGFVGGMQTAGFVMSLIGVIANGLTFVTCTLCTGCSVCAAGGLAGLGA